MIKRRLAAWLMGAVLAVLAVVTMLQPLRVFNFLMPKDEGSARVATGIAYGEGTRRMLDIYAPNGDVRDRQVIVFFYGGSWSSGTRKEYDFIGRALAAQGFVVVIPDYRLVPEVRYPDFLKDGASAVRWTRMHIHRFGGDGERIVLAGHSAGAYIAAMLSLDPHWLGVDRQAVRGLVGLAGPYDFLPFDKPASVAAFGHWPDPRDTQPVNHVGSDNPPTLLLLGSDDTTVVPRNSLTLAARLKAAGGRVRLILYHGIGHVGIATALARPFRSRAPVLDGIARFVRDVTRDSASRTNGRNTDSKKLLPLHPIADVAE